MEADLIVARPEGLYCPAGDFYIDPWRPVHRAVITHAHADHARRGHGHYLAAAPAEGVLRSRLGPITLQTLPYGEQIDHHGVRLSLHPAGHVLGSAQVRVTRGDGHRLVYTGDLSLDPVELTNEVGPCSVRVRTVYLAERLAHTGTGSRRAYLGCTLGLGMFTSVQYSVLEFSAHTCGGESGHVVAPKPQSPSEPDASLHCSKNGGPSIPACVMSCPFM